MPYCHHVQIIQNMYTIDNRKTHPETEQKEEKGKCCMASCKKKIRLKKQVSVALFTTAID